MAGPTAVTGLRTAIGGADLVLPAWARTILAIRPLIIDSAPTADQELLTSISLESDDFSVQPYEVLCNPLQTVASFPVQSAEAQWFPVNCPVNGGDRLRILGNELDAGHATDPYAMVQIILSDKKAGGQYHAKIGTATVSGAATIRTAEASYTITGGHTLEEIYGAVIPTALAIDEGIAGIFEFISNDLGEPTPLKLPTAPMHGAETAVGIGVPSLARAKVEVPILSPCKLSNYLTLTTTLTAGEFITGVLYR